MHLCVFAKEIYCLINKSLCCLLEAFSGVTLCKIPSTDVNSWTQIFLYLSLISVNENRLCMSKSTASTHCSCTEPVAPEPTAPVAGSLIFFLLVASLKIYGKSQTMTLLLMTIWFSVGRASIPYNAVKIKYEEDLSPVPRLVSSSYQ